MTTTHRLQALQDHVVKPTPVAGNPTRIWLADVSVVHQDGTVTCQPVSGRATKVNVPVLEPYVPHTGDRVAVTNINGDNQSPLVLGVLARTSIPAVTGSRSGGAALTSLLTILADLNLIVDHTTS